MNNQITDIFTFIVSLSLSAGTGDRCLHGKGKVSFFITTRPPLSDKQQASSTDAVVTFSFFQSQLAEQAERYDEMVYIESNILDYAVGVVLSDCHFSLRFSRSLT